MFDAIITRRRYFGGGLGRIPSNRRIDRLKKPRGFFNPDSSASNDWSVPMSPPPPPMPPMTIREMRRAGGGSPGSSRSRSRCNVATLPGERYAVPWHDPDVMCAASEAAPPTCAPRLPRASASSKNAITPPYFNASLRSLRKSDFTLRIPTPMNMLVKAPGSMNTNGRPVSPATASAISVLPVPGGPYRRIPDGT